MTHSPFLYFVNADTNSDGIIFPKYTSLIPSIDEKNVSGTKSQYKIAPEFEEPGEGVNIIDINDGQPLTMAGLKGKVVLVNFWTYSWLY